MIGEMLLHYFGIAARVGALTVLILAVAIWLNWRRLGKPKPPDDFK